MIIELVNLAVGLAGLMSGRAKKRKRKRDADEALDDWSKKITPGSIVYVNSEPIDGVWRPVSPFPWDHPKGTPLPGPNRPLAHVRTGAAGKRTAPGWALVAFWAVSMATAATTFPLAALLGIEAVETYEAGVRVEDAEQLMELRLADAYPELREWEAQPTEITLGAAAAAGMISFTTDGSVSADDFVLQFTDAGPSPLITLAGDGTFTTKGKVTGIVTFDDGTWPIRLVNGEPVERDLPLPPLVWQAEERLWPKKRLLTAPVEAWLASTGVSQ